MLRKYSCVFLFAFWGLLIPKIEAKENDKSNLILISKSGIAHQAKDDLKSFHKKLKKKLNKSEQLVIVTTKDWDETEGTLSYYQKEKFSWKLIAEKIPVVIGKRGLGWGSGLIDFPKVTGPNKKEGDGKSPAGLFKLSSAFGYLPRDSVRWIKLPYLQSTESVECVDDSISNYYNKLVDTNTTKKDWKSFERMKLRSNLYKYGIFIEHNSHPVVKGGGSCIFFHIWSENKTPSTGCTTLSENKLIELLKWLSPGKNPTLLQLTNEEFEKIAYLVR